MPRKRWMLIVALGGVLVVAAGTTQAPAAPQPPTSRTIYMSAVEYEGGANVASECYPLDPGCPPPAGTERLSVVNGPVDGYEMDPPDPSGRWVVETHRWEPAFLEVGAGEHITLEILGINDNSHDSRLVSPTGEVVRTIAVKRGWLTKVEFVAKPAGLWQLICDEHLPAMVADILVTPGRS